MIQLILVKIYISTFLSSYYLFGLMVIIVHKFVTYLTYSRGAVRSVASSYAAVRIVAGSRPVLVIA